MLHHPSLSLANKGLYLFSQNVGGFILHACQEVELCVTSRGDTDLRNEKSVHESENSTDFLEMFFG